MSSPASYNTFCQVTHASGTLRNRLSSITRSTLGAGGSLHDAIALPKGEKVPAWVAVHAIDFYNEVSTLWAVMAADPFVKTFQPGEGFPSNVEYRWSEGGSRDVSPTTIDVSAPVYINKVLTWTMHQINDESQFPDDEDEEYALRVFASERFATLCGQIFRRLFRVYAIIFFSFFRTFDELEMAPHVNTSFKHVSFGLHFLFVLTVFM
uniref:Uncharacterized protein n=2 Tax=Corethron hystrix TaxID=216773 RepID=A0A7S1C1S3_9STRA|mmetsp:Transcript_9018/g.19941  ORF Transcript_9018/g.19941 Transcript_9018/m.19941 type:complete len:208 (+) Transcript_9018:384-1007(+)